MNKLLQCTALIFFLLSAVCSAAQEDRGDDTAFSTPDQMTAVQVRKLPKEKIEALKKSEDYWYANFEPVKKDVPEAQTGKQGRSLFSQAWFTNLMWILILCSFIGVVGWYLAASNIRLFRHTSKAIYTEERPLETAEDIFSIQYEKEIARAEASSDFRLAIRLWYLKTLKILADNKQIVYSPQRPDGDYVAALSGSRYHRGFFRLTRVFEYAWYGQFPLTSEAYSKVQVEFQNFQSSLSA